MLKNVLSEKKATIANLRGTGKVAKSFDPAVRNAILAMADTHPSLKSFTFHAVTPAYKFYAGEGYEYTMVVGEEQRGIEMVAEHNLGAANVSHAINAPITVPVGGFLITISYYGGYIMNVYNVQPERIETPEEPKALPAVVETVIETVIQPVEPKGDLVDYARRCLAESIGLNLDLIDATRESTICFNCGSKVPALKNHKDVCLICGEAPYTLPNGVLNVNHFDTAIISVDYKEMDADTYNGLELRVAYGYSANFVLLFKTPKSYEAKMQKRFESDWTVLCKYISKMGWADKEFECSSSVDNFMQDARINGAFMGR